METDMKAAHSNTKNSAQAALLSAYRGIQGTGLFEYAVFERVLSHAYFVYKKHVEDSYARLADEHPGLFKGGHVLDVGANIGYTASIFASVMSPGRCVFAFEPEAKNFRMLRKYVAAHHLENTVSPIHAAVGSADGSVALWYNPVHLGDHRVMTDSFKGEGQNARSEQVPLFSIDSFMARELPGEPVSFIKIDVQGYEPEVCQGMSRTLANNPDATIGIEYAPEGIRTLGFSPAELTDFFKDRGYKLYLLTRKDGVRPLTYDSLDTQLGEKPYADLIFTRRTL
jgi:FkbM family methyltransferase